MLIYICVKLCANWHLTFLFMATSMFCEVEVILTFDH